MVYYPSFGDCSMAVGAGEFCGWESGWGAMIVVSMLIVLFFYAIVYMFSFFLQSEEMKRSAKSHLFDTIFSALMAILIIGLLTAFFQYMKNDIYGGTSVDCEVFGTIKLGDGATPFDVIRCRLMEKASYVTQIYENVFMSSRGSFEKLSMAWGLFGLPIYQQGAYIWQTTMSDVYKEVENYRLLAHICVVLMIGLNAYLSAVNYVEMNMLRMFLPIGIVLRSIPFTRNIGAFFMAVAVGFYVIFPYLYVITDPGFYKTAVQYVDITDDSNILFPWPTFKGAVAMMTLPPKSLSSLPLAGAMSISEIASDLTKFYYELIIQPFVILSITMVFVRYLTNLLGGESQELYRLAAKVI
mgnify:CR=1 FL=1